MAAADYIPLVQSLYLSYFGRPADTLGLLNFSTQLDTLQAPLTINGLDEARKTNTALKTLIDSFGTSAESAALYTGDSIAFVTAIYANVLNRAPDFEGLVWWATEINSGRVTKAGASLAIMAGAVNNTSAQGLIDAKVVANKVLIATQFTTSIDTGSELAAYSGNAAAATAREMMKTVTDTSTVAGFQATIDATLVALVDSSVEGKTITLTTGIDTGAAFVGGAGGDIFQATSIAGVASLSALDVLNGGNGTDTINITETGAIANVASATISNIEKAIVVGGAAVTLNMSGWTGLTSATVVAAGATTLTAAGTTSITSTTSAGAVIVNGGSTVSIETDASAVDVNGVAGTTVVSVTGGAGVTIDDVNGASTTKASTIKTVSIDGAAGAVGIVTGALSTLSLANTDQVVTVTDNLTTTTATTLALSIDELATGAELIAAKPKTLNITTVGDASEIKLTTAAAETIAVAGTEDLTLTAGGTYTALKTFTVAGEVGVTGDLSGAASLATITSTSTGAQALTIAATAKAVTLAGGADTLTQAAALGATQAVNTGAGNDKVILGGALTAGAVIDGSTGTDTLSLTSAVATAATNDVQEAVFTGFEAIEISNALAAALNMSNLDSIQNLVLAAGSGAFTVSGLTSGATVTYGAVNTATSSLAVTNAAVSTSDTINLVFTNLASKDFLDVNAADVETVNVSSLDADDDNDPGAITHTVGLGNTLTTLNVTGDAGLIIDTAMTTVTKIAAGAFDAGLTVDLTGNTNKATITTGAGDDDITVADADNTIAVGGGDNIVVAGDGDNVITLASDTTATTGNDITVGNGDNTITDTGTKGATIGTGDGNNTITTAGGVDVVTVGAGANVISVGAGNDTVNIGAASGLNTVNVGAGTDTVALVGIQTAAGYYTSVTGMTAGDKISFAGVTDTASAGGALGAKITLGGASSFANYLDAATATLMADNDPAIIKWFQFNGNTYIVVDNEVGGNDTTTFQDGVDSVIELVGLVTLTTSTVAADVLTLV
jgi:S-layer protein